MTLEEINYIRTEYVTTDKSMAEIARELEIQPSTVRDLLKGNTHKKVPWSEEQRKQAEQKLELSGRSRKQNHYDKLYGGRK